MCLYEKKNIILFRVVFPIDLQTETVPKYDLKGVCAKFNFVPCNIEKSLINLHADLFLNKEFLNFSSINSHPHGFSNWQLGAYTCWPFIIRTPHNLMVYRALYVGRENP